MDRDPYNDYNEYIRKRRKLNDGLTEKKVESMIKEAVEKNKPHLGWLKALTILLLIYSLVMTYFVVNKVKIGETTNPVTQESTISIKNDNVSVENAVAKKALDSVVGITTVGVQENIFFQKNQVVEGVGSGVIVSKDGYILTNSHVIQDGKAETIEVLLTNGKKSPAQLLWYDTTLDLAVVKVNMKGLKPVEMADSDKVEIGDKAIAIGNPLGLDLQSTLTSGYISGKDRTITIENGLQMDGLMQTDAAINAGNSGGGLFDKEGKLIGINTAKASAEGIGFTIPINVAKTIVDNIVSGGSFEGVKLGISGIDVRTFQQATRQEMPIEKGIYVVEVVNPSSAQKAGVQKGDIITKINGKEISSMSSLKKALLEVRPKQNGKITVYRNGKEHDLNIVFDTLKEK